MTRIGSRLAGAGLAWALGLSGAALANPLDGLTGEEYQAVTAILRQGELADADTLYPLIELIEPPKAQVLAWDGGAAPDRRARAHFSGPDGGYYTATVNITDGAVEESGPAAGQPMILFAEFITAMEAALAHPDMLAGLKVRGLTPDDVFCLPLTAGNFLTEEEEGTRLMKVPCYVNPTGSNFYAKPIEGLFAVVDLAAGKALRVVDEGAVPVPQDPWGYTEAEVAERMPLRPRSNPVTLEQEGGSNIRIDGNVIEWDIWRMHLRVDKRPGVVLSNIDVRDGETWRSVLYQAHLSEVFVPYMDPGEGWYWRTYMDSGEYGFGLFLTPLTPGVDCPRNAVYLPAMINDDNGNPLQIPDAVCVFERSLGDPAWRHFEVFAQSPDALVPAEGRPASELIVRSASEVGNYDYLIDYRFQQSGKIEIRIGSTGIDAVKGVAATSMDDPTAEADTRYGTLIAPNLVAPFHDHYFNFRLDFDVDQPVNRFETLDIVPANLPDDLPRRSMWTVERTVPDSELDARYQMGAKAPRAYRFANPAGKGPLGHEPGYLIQRGSVAYGPFDFADDPPMKRNAFIENSVWVTPFDPAERYAGGEFALQSDGSDTLAQWVQDDESLADTDVVAWFTVGARHVPRTEDWPVMSTSWKGIEIVPDNFFPTNPGLTIRSPVN